MLQMTMVSDMFITDKICIITISLSSFELVHDCHFSIKLRKINLKKQKGYKYACLKFQSITKVYHSQLVRSFVFILQG